MTSFEQWKSILLQTHSFDSDIDLVFPEYLKDLAIQFQTYPNGVYNGTPFGSVTMTFLDLDEMTDFINNNVIVLYLIYRKGPLYAVRGLFNSPTTPRG